MNDSPALDYTSYDRQLDIFCNMVEGFVVGFEEYSATELSWDIHSLCQKASRLCLMADQDAVLQQQTLTDERRLPNHHHHARLASLIFEQLTPLLHHLLIKCQQGEILVGNKNQWFCVWSVLCHHNLLADKHFEAFATQMMHPDWFGGTNLPQFRGDNISDYGDYFGETDYRLWNITTFHTYRDLHSKPLKKWSDKLFTTFQRLCFEMDEMFEYQ